MLKYRRARVAPIFVIFAAACANPGRHAVVAREGDAAVVIIERPLAQLYEFGIAEVRSRGAVEHSSLQNCYIEGRSQHLKIRLQFEETAAANSGVPATRVLVFVKDTKDPRGEATIPGAEPADVEIARSLAIRARP